MQRLHRAQRPPRPRLARPASRLSKDSASPGHRCANASRYACRNGRRSPSGARAPGPVRRRRRRRSGCPIDARCVRIWCVRPVSSLTSSSAQPAKRSRHAEPRHRRAPVGEHGHPRAVTRVAADRRVDLAAVGRRDPGDEREVAPLDLARLHRGDEPLVRLVGLRHDEQAGHVPVEPVDDPGPALAGARGERAPVRRERVDERARRARPGAAWTTTPAGLDTTSRCVVLVDDLDARRRLGAASARARRPRRRRPPRPCTPCARRDRVDRHQPVVDQRAGPRARDRRRPGDEDVEPRRRRRPQRPSARRLIVGLRGAPASRKPGQQEQDRRRS